MKKSTRNILISTGVVLLCPLPLLPVAVAGIGGVLAFKGIKKVKKGYVSGIRQRFSKGDDKNRNYSFSGGGYTKEQLDACKSYLEDVIKVGFLGNTGFIPRTVPSGATQGLKITTIDPRTGKRVMIDEYDNYNPLTSCAEIPTRTFDQLVNDGKGTSKIVKCNRVAVKLDKHGRIDWSKPSNKNLFKNPQAVGEVLRRYPESFATIPNEVLAQSLPGTTITMGDYFQRTIKKEAIERLNGSSEYWSIIPRREDGSFRTSHGYIVDLHKMMQDKINDYSSQYGRGSNAFATSANAWTRSSSTESYFDGV